MKSHIPLNEEITQTSRWAGMRLEITLADSTEQTISLGFCPAHRFIGRGSGWHWSAQSTSAYLEMRTDFALQEALARSP